MLRTGGEAPQEKEIKSTNSIKIYVLHEKVIAIILLQDELKKKIPKNPPIVTTRNQFNYEIICNASLMKQGDFINVFLARHVSGTYAHHQEH